jgi:hypothetical protein
MPRLPAFRSLPLAAFLAGAFLMLGSMLGAEAQQGPEEAAEQATAAHPNGHRVPRRDRGVGFYSLTLSDIWGPAKMPPAPKDFGPHFDFPPEPLNGAPLHDPYPN